MDDKITISEKLLLALIEMSTMQSKQIRINAEAAEQYREQLEEIEKWVVNCGPPKKHDLPTAHEEVVENIREILGLEVRCGK